MTLQNTFAANTALNGLHATRILNQAQLDLRDHVQAGTVCMLWGDAGIGKSAMVAETAADLGWGFRDERPSLRESIDYRGAMFPDLETRKTVWFQPDEFPTEERDGPNGIWLLDEINACRMDVQVALYQLIWDGCIGNYKKPKGWILVCAGNRITDGAGAQRMSKALENRVAHIDVEVDPIAWCSWAAANGIHPMLISLVQFNAGILYKNWQGAREHPTPRSWAMASRYLNIADRAKRLRLVSQCVGKDAAGIYESFADTLADLVPLHVILADPDQAPIPTPDKLASMFAVTGALANAIDAKTARNAARYVKRLPADMHALFSHLVRARDPNLAARGWGDLIISQA